MDECKTAGCQRPVKTRGYCGSHYQTFRHSPEWTQVKKQPSTPATIRFWRRVAIGAPDGCWNWTGPPQAITGYGEFVISMDAGKTRAHRFAWIDTHGPVPDGLVVCHTCDNRLCCNPAHLWLGTQGDNLRDMAAKGRWGNQHAGKTHCPAGHPYDEANTQWLRGGTERRCATCHRVQSRERYRRRRAH